MLQEQRRYPRRSRVEGNSGARDVGEAVLSPSLGALNRSLRFVISLTLQLPHPRTGRQELRDRVAHQQRRQNTSSAVASDANRVAVGAGTEFGWLLPDLHGNTAAAPQPGRDGDHQRAALRRLRRPPARNLIN